MLKLHNPFNSDSDIVVATAMVFGGALVGFIAVITLILFAEYKMMLPIALSVLISRLIFYVVTGK